MHTLLPLTSRHPAVRERKLHIFVDREVAYQIEGLEDESDGLVADLRPLRSREAGYGLAVEQIVAHRWRVQQPEDREQRGLTATRRPGDRHELTRFDLQVDVGQGVGFHFFGVKNLTEAFQVDQHGFVALLYRVLHHPSFVTPQVLRRM